MINPYKDLAEGLKNNTSSSKTFKITTFQDSGLNRSPYKDLADKLTDGSSSSKTVDVTSDQDQSGGLNFTDYGQEILSRLDPSRQERVRERLRQEQGGEYASFGDQIEGSDVQTVIQLENIEMAEQTGGGLSQAERQKLITTRRRIDAVESRENVINNVSDTTGKDQQSVITQLRSQLPQSSLYSTYSSDTDDITDQIEVTGAPGQKVEDQWEVFKNKVGSVAGGFIPDSSTLTWFLGFTVAGLAGLVVLLSFLGSLPDILMGDK